MRSTSTRSATQSAGRLGPPRVRVVALASCLAIVLSVTPAVAVTDTEPAPVETAVDAIETFEVERQHGGWQVSEVARSPIPFTMLGFAAPAGTTLEARVADDEWGDWFELEFLEDIDGPDPGTLEARDADDPGRGLVHTEPVWVEQADRVQVRIEGGALEDVVASVIDSDGLSRTLFERIRASFRPGLSVAPAEASTPLTVVSRRQWGADESKRRGSPSYVSSVQHIVVHHTAHTSNNPNGYTRTQAASIMRGMYAYHTDTLGWSDLGYNIVIDRFGTIYEGRAGGLGRAVMGAHAGGFNSRSVGIAVMGNFESVAPPAAAMESLASVIAWKAHIHDMPVTGNVTVTSAGNGRFAKGTNVSLPRIGGHRDTGWTACPGTTFAGRFGTLRTMASQRLPAAPPPHGFTDVTDRDYFESPVRWLTASGITNGVGSTNTYAPGASVTRAQMAAFLWRLAGRPTGHPHHGFPDVPSTGYYAEAVRWMVANGITDGVGNTGRFEPHREVRRGESAAFLWRALGEPSGDPPHRFSDVAAGDFYEDAVRWMRANGITDGVGSTNEFQARRDITRGEMAAILHRVASTPPAWRSSSFVSPHATYRI